VKDGRNGEDNETDLWGLVNASNYTIAKRIM
jgi:hypothetical protein